MRGTMMCAECATDHPTVAFSEAEERYLCHDCYGQSGTDHPEPQNASAPPPREPTRSSTTTPPSPKEVPNPSTLNPHVPHEELGDEPEVEWLLREWEAGGIPVESPLVLPPGLPGSARVVGEFFGLILALRLWACDERPIPFACGWVGLKVGLSDRTVWRARIALVEADVLTKLDPLPGRGKRGTDLFLPGPLLTGAVGVERRAEGVRETTNVEREVVDHALMLRAVGTVPDRSLATAWDRTSDGDREVEPGRVETHDGTVPPAADTNATS